MTTDKTENDLIRSELETMRAELHDLRDFVYKLPSATQSLMVKRAGEKTRRLRAIGTLAPADALAELAKLTAGDVRECFATMTMEQTAAIAAVAEPILRDRLLADVPRSVQVQVAVALMPDAKIPRWAWLSATSQVGGAGLPCEVRDEWGKVHHRADISDAFAKELVSWRIGSFEGGVYKLPQFTSDRTATACWPMSIVERLRKAWFAFDEAIRGGVVTVRPCTIAEDRARVITERMEPSRGGGDAALGWRTTVY